MNINLEGSENMNMNKVTGVLRSGLSGDSLS